MKHSLNNLALTIQEMNRFLNYYSHFILPGMQKPKRLIYMLMSDVSLTLTYCPAKSVTSEVKQPEASTGQIGAWSLWIMLNSVHTL